MDGNTFGSFRSTYKFTSFILCVTMIYPHSKTIKRRIIGSLLTILSMLPTLVALFYSTFLSFMDLNILDIIHQTAVLGPWVGGYVKVLISCFCSKEGEEIINEIDRDYAMYNTLPKPYREIAEKWIKNSLTYCQKFWSCLVTVTLLSYPAVPTYLNIKSQLIDENPKRYMLHDALLPFVAPDDRFLSPLFEMIFASMFWVTIVIVSYFIGYESFYALAINHACLKIEIYCKAFEDALKCKNTARRLKKIKAVINEQLRLFNYVNNIQTFFNPALALYLIAVLVEMGTCLYHFTESEDFDLQFMMIGVCSISVIYFLCTYATKLKFTAQESALKFYCSGWENIYCVSTRKTIVFMIKRAQIPMVLLGLNFVVYDMQLFMSLVQSAYSIYTLLCS